MKRRTFASCCLVVASLVVLYPPVARASISASALKKVFDEPTGIVLSDAAFDEVNKVYLYVYGTQAPAPASGIFIDANGNPVSGKFAIGEGFGGWARVVWNPDDNKFLVSYTRYFVSGPKWRCARFVDYKASGYVVGPEIVVSNNVNQGLVGTAVVPGLHKYLVTYWTNWSGSAPMPLSYARTVNSDGSLGTEYLLSNSGDGQSDPEIACDSASKKCLVVGHAWAIGLAPANGSGGGTWGRFIDGNTGAPIGNPFYVDYPTYQSDSRVVFAPKSNKFIVVWNGQMRHLIGKTVDLNGNVSGWFAVKGGVDNDPSGCTFGFGQNRLAAAYNGGTSTAMFGMVDYCGYAWVQETDPSGVATQTLRVPLNPTTEQGDPVLAADMVDARFLVLNHDYGLDERGRWTQFHSVTDSVVQVGANVDPGVPGAPGGVTPPPPPPPQTPPIDLSPGTAPNGSWIFPEGALGLLRNGFTTYYSVANENPAATSIRAWLVNENGTLYYFTDTVPALTRKTYSLSDKVSAASGSYAAIFQSTTAGQQVYVARTMYWGGASGNLASGPGHLKVGSYLAPGQAYPQQWFFAEGSTFMQFATYFLVFNPSSVPANVTLEFQSTTGATLATVTNSVPAMGRWTFYTGQLSALAYKDFSVKVSSSTGVYAERSMYWPDVWSGGHSGIGATDTASDWYFAEGTAQASFETFFLLFNPSGVPVTVDATYQLTAPQSPVTKTYNLPANSRTTIYLPNEVSMPQSGVGAKFSARAGARIVAERSMYWGTGWTEGSTSLGLTAPATTWHLPEGSTTSGYNTYVLIANPSGTPANITVTTFSDSGATVDKSFTVAPNSRLTLSMNNEFPGLTSAFATRVVSTNGIPVVVESAMYWNWLGTSGQWWRGGDATPGFPVIR